MNRDYINIAQQISDSVNELKNRVIDLEKAVRSIKTYIEDPRGDSVDIEKILQITNDVLNHTGI
jgi:hypothetical protein